MGQRPCLGRSALDLAAGANLRPRVSNPAAQRAAQQDQGEQGCRHAGGRPGAVGERVPGHATRQQQTTGRRLRCGGRFDHAERSVRPDGRFLPDETLPPERLPEAKAAADCKSAHDFQEGGAAQHRKMWLRVAVTPVRALYRPAGSDGAPGSPRYDAGIGPSCPSGSLLPPRVEFPRRRVAQRAL
uniref:(northern house mosquito) hypothetical protein n=1 Tax=Culex pipiens TaxID=7175 RepID=A0A8D8IFQ1_CULPI